MPAVRARSTACRRCPPLEWDKATLLSFEREMLGLYVSDHPLFGIEHILADARRHVDRLAASATRPSPTAPPSPWPGSSPSLQLKRTKKGDLWAIATVEDLDGAIECLFFPSAYMTYSTMLAQDTVCAIKGRVSARDDSISIFAQELTIPDIKEGPRGPVVLTLPLGRVTPAVRREPQARARRAPGRDRGAGAADPARPVGAHVARRLAAGRRHVGALRRPQGTPRPGLP